MYNRGLAYAKMDKFEKAVENQKAAIEVTGDHTKIFKMLF